MTYKCAFITGASAGIGAATAVELAKRGMNLFLVARRLDRLAKLKVQLESTYSVSVKIAALDVSASKNVQEFVSQHSAELKSVDVVINNAGLAKGTDKFAEAKTDDWDVMLDTNVKGLLYVTRALLPILLQQPKAHVVNLGSVAGRWVYPGGAVYCATKHAVRALSEGLRMDLIGSNVRVSNIEPGMVETEFSEIRLGSEERAKAVYSGMNPLTAHDIAETIAWCLDRPVHVNIQELVIFPTDQTGIQQVHRRNV